MSFLEHGIPMKASKCYKVWIVIALVYNEELSLALSCVVLALPPIGILSIFNVYNFQNQITHEIPKSHSPTTTL